MIKSVTVTNYLGDSIKLVLSEPEQSGFAITNIDGLGPVKANINTTEISTKDGSMFNSARSNQRNIVIHMIFVPNIKQESIETIRQKTYKYFPTKKIIEISIETDNRIVKTTGYVESNEPVIFSEKEGAQISIICPDSYFYSNQTNRTVFYGMESEFEFPFSNESVSDKLLELGAIQKKTANVIFYNGDAEIGVTIYIYAHGEATDLTIINVRTRESMTIDTTKMTALTGSGIIHGDQIIINTSKGEKSLTLIRDGEEINILNCLAKNTDWFTLSKGDNVFAFSAVEGSSNLQFRIENKIIYEGV